MVYHKIRRLYMLPIVCTRASQKSFSVWAARLRALLERNGGVFVALKAPQKHHHFFQQRLASEPPKQKKTFEKPCSIQNRLCIIFGAGGAKRKSLLQPPPHAQAPGAPSHPQKHHHKKPALQASPIC